MSSSNKFNFFLAVLILLTIVGIVSGFNLNNSNTSLQNQSSVDNKKMIDASSEVIQANESFVTATTSTVTDVTPSIVPQVRRITASAYLVGDVSTGKVYLSSNQNKVLPVASMSKLMTAIVATNKFSTTTTIEITPENASVATDTSAVHAGEKFSFTESLYPLLLNSSNVMAEAIASTDPLATTSTSTTTRTVQEIQQTRLEFLKTMSSTAWEVGMPATYFADPSGLDSHNHATAKDIFALARYIYKFRPDIFEITRIVGVDVATTTEHDSHSFFSIHPFVKDPRFLGGKTGRTPEAGETMLTILNIDDHPIAFIVMHSSYGAREGDTNLLIDKYLAL